MTALPSLEHLVRRIPGVQDTQSLGDVIGLLSEFRQVGAIVVLRGESPIGVVCRDLIADVMRLPCYSAWIGTQCCTQFVSHTPYTICIDACVAEMVHAVAPDPLRHPAEPIVVTRSGAYVGVVERQALSGALAAARHIAPVLASAAHALAPESHTEMASRDIGMANDGFETAIPLWMEH